MKRYWFPAKRYGWGWGFPSAWQGWVVLLLYLAVLWLDARVFTPGGRPLLFTLTGFVATGMLVLVCVIKGEPPHWRWGKHRSSDRP